MRYCLFDDSNEIVADKNLTTLKEVTDILTTAPTQIGSKD